MRAGIAALCTLLVATPAAADIYAFVDEQGVTHFSNVPTDDRYETIIRDVAEYEGVEIHPVFLRRASEFEPLIKAAAANSAVEAELIWAIIVVESGFDAAATSPAGAQGLMQLMPATAAHYGADDVFDPAQNIAAGARYLRDLIDLYGNDFELALAAYNAGEDAVRKYNNQVPPYAETQAYIPKVLGVYNRLRELAAQT